MALSIYHESTQVTESPATMFLYSTELKDEVWNLGKDFPVCGKIRQIAADGDELAFIKQNFSNVPWCTDFTVWDGPMAQFIYNNLKHLLKTWEDPKTPVVESQCSSSH